jgi:hypothetical protein
VKPVRFGWGGAARTLPAGARKSAFPSGGSIGVFGGAGAGGAGGGGGNYGGLIGTSPDLSGLEAEFAASSKADAASRDASLRRLMISYGQLPDFSALGISDSAKGFLSNALNQQSRDLAAKAEAEGVSIHARQAKDNMVSNRRIPASLAGRGLLRSGQTGYDLGEQAQNYKITQYDTLNELLGNVEGTVGGFLSAERERAIALAQARIQAAWDAQSNYGDSYIGDSYDQQLAAGMAPVGAPRAPRAPRAGPRIGGVSSSGRAARASSARARATSRRQQRPGYKGPRRRSGY